MIVNRPLTKSRDMMATTAPKAPPMTEERRDQIKIRRKKPAAKRNMLL
jgi:hypothetical protein